MAVVFSAAQAQPDDNSTDPITNTTTDDEDLMDCPLCADPLHTPQDSFSIFMAGEVTMSCQTAYDMGPLRLPEQNCTFWQQRGDSICQCGSNETSAPNMCTLCKNGEALPDPFLEVRPETICGQMQIQARRDAPQNCVIWQQTYGVYCGCDNENATGEEFEACRLCGENQVFDPLVVVKNMHAAEERQAVEDPLSCGEVEFQANLPDINCDEYLLLYSSQCCREITTAPSQAPSEPEEVKARRHDGSWIIVCDSTAASTDINSLLFALRSVISSLSSCK